MRLRSFSRVVALVMPLLAAAGLAQPAQIGGPLPTLFPMDNWWNVAVTGYSISPNDGTWRAANTNSPLHPDWGGDVMPSPASYGIPYITVPGTEPMIVFDSTQFDYPEQSDYQAPGRPPGYPVPSEAITQPGWIEGGYPGNTPNMFNDQHMLIVDRDNLILYELYQTRYEGGQWHAGSGAIWPLNSNMRRPDGWTSADASGIQMLPGLVKYDEVFGPNPITHALRFTINHIKPDPNGHVYPASHTACNSCSSSAPPMGARLRLKNLFNISTFEPHVQKVLQAMKTYGLILTDGGGNMYITGDYNNHWNDVANPMVSTDTWLNIFHDQFLLVHQNDFEFVTDPGGTQATGNDRLPLSGISPTTRCQGSASFTLTVNAGAGTFVNGTTLVKFNGVTRTTTYVNSGQLTATILASDLLTAGDALVSVTNPPDPDMQPLRFTITADAMAPAVTSPAAATVTQSTCQ